MIIDAHTHIWESPQQLGESLAAPLCRGQRGWEAVIQFPGERPTIPAAAAPHHLAACQPSDKTIVVGFKSHYLAANVPNRYVAGYVQQHPEKLVGFAGVDPSRPAEALEDIDEAYSELGLKGVAIAPAAQDFHPASSQARRVYARINTLGLPLLIHQGLYFSAQHKMEYARPMLLDEIARDWPNLKIIIAHMGYPWIDETVVMLGKHPNVYSDISGLLAQPWRAYNTLLTAFQYGVIDKLLFSSGFPLTSAAPCIEALYSINQIVQGTNLPTIPRKHLRGIVERPTLDLLGISHASSTTDQTQASQMVDDDDAT